ncbi:hypothetical protein Cni_G29314 [Canna indica]|uniref:Secreted protein n=1 Tax=Canna indica TaxID=4628 RepID=A0AAQ3L4N4_9LILI|nr:hypothetical protein Cni_G29314 [Canna indica]
MSYCAIALLVAIPLPALLWDFAITIRNVQCFATDCAIESFCTAKSRHCASIALQGRTCVFVHMGGQSFHCAAAMLWGKLASKRIGHCSVDVSQAQSKSHIKSHLI